MRKIQAGEFKAKCLAILDEVANTHEEIVVTKHGKPVARVLPFNTKKDMDEMPLKGCATYIGDVISPITVEWEAAKK